MKWLEKVSLGSLHLAALRDNSTQWPAEIEGNFLITLSRVAGTDQGGGQYQCSHLHALGRKSSLSLPRTYPGNFYFLNCSCLPQEKMQAHWKHLKCWVWDVGHQLALTKFVIWEFHFLDISPSADVKRIGREGGRVEGRDGKWRTKSSFSRRIQLNFHSDTEKWVLNGFF